MSKHKVSIVRYEEPETSVRRAVELAGGIKATGADKVYLKPNIVHWSSKVMFPKWGMITTARVVHDMVKLLAEQGVQEITIGEGSVTMDPRDREEQRAAFEYMGYNQLARRYGVKLLNIFDRPFRKLDLGDAVELRFNEDILETDLIVDLPAMKTHAQTDVSLGIKNFKGVIDIASRRKCHNPDPVKDLHFYVARLADKVPPVFTLIDGIYSLERGPVFNSRAHRTNLLIASGDILCADKVGATVLGHPPSEVRHLVHAAKNHGRSIGMDDIEIVGEELEKVISPLPSKPPYTEDGTNPAGYLKMGIEGLSYRKYDSTICTYCSSISALSAVAIPMAWKGRAWDDVEILSGKKMQPTPGKKKTILLGRCMSRLHKDNPDIKKAFAVNGCPPDPMQAAQAFTSAGVEVDHKLYENWEQFPAWFNKPYEGKAEFDETFFKIG